MLARAQISHLELQCYKILFISGRSTSRLNRNITQLDVRRAFTVFQLMTIPGGEPPQLPGRGARPAALRSGAGPSPAEAD
jgi:hypothetical protein